MLLPLSSRLERVLYKRGFTSISVCRLIGTQILVTVSSLLIGSALAPITLWFLAFGIGAFLTTCSLWHIARFAQIHIRQAYSTALGLRLFLGFTMRLLLMGIALFVLIVWLRIPLIPLLLGLSSTIVSITAWGIGRLSRKTV